MSTTVRSSVAIERSPEQIVEILLDPEKAPLWNRGLERFEVITEAPGLVGSRARLHCAEGGRRYTMEDELLEVTPNRRFLSRVAGEALEAEVETLLVPAGQGTLVTICWSGRGRKLLSRVALPVMRWSLGHQIQDDLEALKRLAETSGGAFGEVPLRSRI